MKAFIEGVAYTVVGFAGAIAIAWLAAQGF